MSNRLQEEWIDSDSGESIKFKIRGLSVFVVPEIDDTVYPGTMYNPATREKVAVMRMGAEGLEKCVMNGLVDWKGILDEEDNEVPFDLSKVNMLTANEVELIGYSVLGKSRLGGEGRKKLSSQQTSPGTRKSTTAKRAKKGTATKKRKPGSKSTK